MIGKAVTATILGLVCVFAAITVSVVRARDPFPAEVGQSFESAVSKQAKKSAGARVAPVGCRKRAVYIYVCSAVVLPRRQLKSSTILYKLTLRDDGCWSAVGRPVTARLAIRPVQGCLSDD